MTDDEPEIPTESGSSEPGPPSEPTGSDGSLPSGAGSDADESESGPQDGVAPVSRDEQRRSRSEAQRRKQMIGAGIAAAVVVVLAVVILITRSGGEEPVASTTTTSTTTTSSTTTTIAPELATAVMPLTGTPVDGDDPAVASVMEAPALAVKIDNDPLSLPYIGVNAADVVIEVRVEGISRNIAIFHSVLPEEVGAVRSARTSDPDLLAMLNKPVFAASGGNAAVMRRIRSTPWIVVADHDAVQRDYFRQKGRKAPHNLMIWAARLRDDMREDALAPQQIFEYVPYDEESTGVPASRIRTTVGATRADFDWDEETSKWVRINRTGPMLTADGNLVAVTNVVVLTTNYVSSDADSRSPESQSLGEGHAWVFADGKVVAGRWTRAERERPWTLTADDGSVMRLMPGNTWVLLPDASAGTPVVDQ